MPSTYTSNNKIQKIATGEQSGTWGNTTNTNFDLFDTAIDGFVNITLSGTTHTLNIPDGSAGDGRNKVLVFTGTLAATNTVSVTPNTVKKHYYVQNNTTGGQNIVISQGSGSSVTIKPGYSSIVYLDGAGSGAAVKEVLTSLKLTALLEATGAVLNGSSSGSTTLQASATASGTLTLPAATDTLVGKATTDTFTNKTFDTAGTGNVLRINGTQVSAVTGTGSVVLATSPTLVTPLLGTPTSGTLTNCTGLPVSTGISGLGANVATFLATPSSANLASAVTDETGSGALVFATSPVLVTPILGTPNSGNLANCFGYNVNVLAGAGTGVREALAVNVGTAGSFVVNGGVLGTPSSGTLTNCTGLPVSTGISGLGSGVATFLATPSSANLAAAVTDETGTGALVFGTSPTIATPTITTSAVIPVVNGGTTASSTLTIQSTSGAGTSDAIIFRTASQLERMRVSTAGDVNIGSVNDAGNTLRFFDVYNTNTGSNAGVITRLITSDVAGTGTAVGQMLKYKNGTMLFQNSETDSAASMQFYVGASERVRITSSGNVGIGTSSPGEKLVVVGNIVAGNTGTTADGYIDIDGGATGKVRISRTGTGATASGMVFYTQFSTLQERMRILSTGEVGIGTSSPAQKLDVVGNLLLSGQSTAEQYIKVGYGRSGNGYSYIDLVGDTTYAPGTRLIRGNTGANAISSLEHRGTGDLRIVNYEAAPICFYTSSSEKVRIDSSGNLLVGTTSSLAKLTAAGGTAAGAVALVTSGQTGTTVRSNSVFRIQSEAAGRDVHMQFSDNIANATEIGMISGSTYFCTGAAERMRINSSGLVGIGLTPTTSLLEVNGEMAAINAFASLRLMQTVTGTGYRWALNNDGTLRLQYTTNAFSTASIPILIDSVGNVKVGGTADRATTAGTNQVVIFNGAAPVGTLANGCSFYSTAGEMRVMDAAGNATLLSPHDSVTNEWIYDSSHTPSGKRLKINVERLLRFINDHFGLDCVHDLMEEA